jgi:threonine dehydrogenase-like Zn-dependent dehydrogenase
MSEVALAQVLVADRKLELREFPLPDVGPDDGLLRVDRCGICGSDVDQFDGTLLGGSKPGSPARYPLIPGHEPLGTIAKVGKRAASRWGVAEGDRVIVETTNACGNCPECNQGLPQSCRQRQPGLGFLTTEIPPSLWGGYATYLYLQPNSILHHVSPGLDLDTAATYNALAAGLAWAVDAPGTTIGDTVAILGPGQRGLASLLAARAAGASSVFITGLARDQHKLDLAVELGAAAAIDVEKDDAVEQVMHLTGGRGVDIVVDVASNSPHTLVDAVAMAKPGGRIVLAGMNGGRFVEGFCTDEVGMKALTIKGVFSKKSNDFRRAIALIEARMLPVERLHTHTFALEDAELALRTLRGEVEGAAAICTSLAPNGT